MAHTAERFGSRYIWAIGGPLLLGLLSGLRFGVLPTLRLGPAFLISIVVTALVMGPALYLLWALTGARASLGDVRRAFVDALAAAGRVHLGFAPAVLLLAATVSYRGDALAIALGALAAGLLLGAVRLWRGLRPGASAAHATVVLVPWLASALLLGARLIVTLVDHARLEGVVL
jgi:hypothetical protein